MKRRQSRGIIAAEPTLAIKSLLVSTVGLVQEPRISEFLLVLTYSQTQRIVQGINLGDGGDGRQVEVRRDQCHPEWRCIFGSGNVREVSQLLNQLWSGPGCVVIRGGRGGSMDTSGHGSGYSIEHQLQRGSVYAI